MSYSKTIHPTSSSGGGKGGGLCPLEGVSHPISAQLCLFVDLFPWYLWKFIWILPQGFSSDLTSGFLIISNPLFLFWQVTHC